MFAKGMVGLWWWMANGQVLWQNGGTKQSWLSVIRKVVGFVVWICLVCWSPVSCLFFFIDCGLIYGARLVNKIVMRVWGAGWIGPDLGLMWVSLVILGHDPVGIG